MRFSIRVCSWFMRRVCTNKFIVLSWGTKSVVKNGGGWGCRKSRWLFGIIFSAVVCENILLKLIRGTRCGASAWRHHLAAGRSSPGAGWLECAFVGLRLLVLFRTGIQKAREWTPRKIQSAGWCKSGVAAFWGNLLAELSGEPATDFSTVCFQS